MCGPSVRGTPPYCALVLPSCTPTQTWPGLARLCTGSSHLKYKICTVKYCVLEPEPRHVCEAGAVTLCGSGSGRDPDGQLEDILKITVL
jgi:hypothetical protein